MVRLTPTSPALYDALTVMRKAGNIVDRIGHRKALITGPDGPRYVSTMRLIKMAAQKKTPLAANENMHVTHLSVEPK